MTAEQHARKIIELDNAWYEAVEDDCVTSPLAQQIHDELQYAWLCAIDEGYTSAEIYAQIERIDEEERL